MTNCSDGVAVKREATSLRFPQSFFTNPSGKRNTVGATLGRLSYYVESPPLSNKWAVDGLQRHSTLLLFPTQLFCEPDRKFVNPVPTTRLCDRILSLKCNKRCLCMTDMLSLSCKTALPFLPQKRSFEIIT